MLALIQLCLVAWSGADPIPAEHGPEFDVGTDPQAIYGGEPVEPGEWEAVVAVTTSASACSGTLVAPDLVLTAAHCFRNLPGSTPVLIQFGDNTSGATLEFTSVQWGVHADFCLPSVCGEDLYDLAWVRLSAPVVGVEPIAPITDQAEFDEAMTPGVELVFVGFGEDELGDSGIKRVITTPLISFTESGREFRAGGDGKDTCFGDSGGPALVQLSSGEIRLAGVLSRGGVCGEGGYYGIPMPELCWLRDQSGVDLLPDGCAACDCVMLWGEQPDEGCDCALAGGVGPSSSATPSWLFMELGLLVIGVAWRRRRPGRATLDSGAAA